MAFDVFLFHLPDMDGAHPPPVEFFLWSFFGFVCFFGFSFLWKKNSPFLSQFPHSLHFINPLPPPNPPRCWNQNSRDTGGIVGNNWLEIMWNKVSWLEKATGLAPWWKEAALNGGVTSKPAPSKIVPMPTQSRGVQPYCSDFQPTAQYSCPQHMAWGKRMEEDVHFRGSRTKKTQRKSKEKVKKKLTFSFPLAK